MEQRTCQRIRHRKAANFETVTVRPEAHSIGIALAYNCSRGGVFLITTFTDGTKEEHMINWAITFLVIALVAGLLGFTGIAGTSANIAWILFVVGLVLAVVMFLSGRRPGR